MKNLNSYPEYSRLLTDFLEKKRPYLRERSYVTYRNALLRFLAWKQAHFSDANMLYISYLLERGVSKRTAHNAASGLKTLLSEVSKEIGQNINDLSEYKKLKYTTKSPMYFSDPQLKIIMREIILNKPYLHLACALMYSCFIRPNELRHLKAQDVNIDAWKITIRGNISKNGKEQKVSIPQSLRQMCRRLWDVPPGNYIFSRNDFMPGKIIAHQHAMSRYFRKVLKKLKIEGNYSFYSLKHSGVVHAVKAGINIKEIQVQLRHHSLDMVNEYLKNLGVYDLEDIDAKMPTLPV